MKHVTIAAILLVLLAGSVSAATIHDIRTGAVPLGFVVEVEGVVVTAVQANSFTVTELPAGPYAAIWVYQGATPTVNIGDVVDIRALNRDNHGRAELSLLWPHDACCIVVGSAPVPVLDLTTTELMADPEAWESAVITISDGMIVQELLPRGRWHAISVETGLSVFFDDYFFDFATVDIGDCYNNAFGLFTWYDGAYYLKVISVALTDCTIGNERLSFGEMKVIYR